MKTTIIVVLAVLLLAMPVLGDLIPSTSPCWVKGTVAVNGNVANSAGLTLTATVAGTQQKSATLNSTGIFSFNSIQGNSGDTVILKVCGLYNLSSPQMQFAFAPYCTTTDAEPWIVKAIEFFKAADSTVGCTCDSICTSGHCVNPGTTGICSPYTYFCDDDGSCETAFGETASNCNADCGTTSGGSGSGGGGGSSVAASETTPPQNIPAGSTGNFVITDSDLFVSGIALEVTDAETGAKVTIRITYRPSGAPAPIDSAIGSTFKYLSISSSVKPSGLKSAEISFSVPMSWFSANGLDQTSVKLMHWSDGAWQPLSTTLLGSSKGNYNFKATSPGLSTFAIVANSASGGSALQLLDMIRQFYAGKSTYTALQLLDSIRAFYGGQ
jgi:PGF-pre-PGF domain-containing protein